MDTIANLLTTIKNGYMAQKNTVVGPYSGFGLRILEILANEGFLNNFKVISLGAIKKFEIQLKYDGRQPAIDEIIKISTPGRRIYRRSHNIPKVLSGLGITIVSTPKGVMTDRQAQSKKLGGEVICQVW